MTFLYSHHSARLPFYCSNNIAFPRLALQQLGGFDESFPLAAAEDRDICDRWAAQAHLQHAPDAIVVHHQSLTFRSYWRQHFRYGRGAFHFHTRRSQRGQAGLRVEPLAFYSRLLGYPWRVHRFVTATAICALLAAAQIANAAGFLKERISCR